MRLILLAGINAGGHATRLLHPPFMLKHRLYTTPRTCGAQLAGEVFAVSARIAFKLNGAAGYH